MPNTKRIIAAVILLIVGLYGASFADVVCRLAKIQGFDHEYENAKKAIGNQTTTDIDSCEVYITKKGDSYYYHSNFVSEGAENPTKIATSSADLEVIIQNIYGLSETSSQLEIRKVSIAHSQNVKYHIDQSVFDQSGRLPLELQGAERLFVVFDGSPPPKPISRSNSIRGPPFIAEYERSLFIPVTSSRSPKQFFSELKNRSFNRKDLRFVSLIPDSATEGSINNSRLAQIRETCDSPTLDSMKDIFQKNSGKTVVVLGHVEGENFVATDPTGQTTVLSFNIEQLETMASAAKCDVIMLGCSSAQATTSIGVDRPFNPVEAVASLNRALDSDSLFTFVGHISGQERGLVFGDAAFEFTLSKKLEAEIFHRNDLRPSVDQFKRPVREGRLVVVFPGTHSSSSTTGASSNSHASADSGTNLPAQSDDASSTRKSALLWSMLGIAVLGILGYFVNRSRKIA